MGALWEVDAPVGADVSGAFPRAFFCFGYLPEIRAKLLPIGPSDRHSERDLNELALQVLAQERMVGALPFRFSCR